MSYFELFGGFDEAENVSVNQIQLTRINLERDQNWKFKISFFFFSYVKVNMLVTLWLL